MKKIFFLSMLLISATFSFSQFTQKRTLANSQTLAKFDGGLKVDTAFMCPVYPDTLAANNNKAEFYDGALIRTNVTPPNSLGMRDSANNVWVSIFSPISRFGVSGEDDRAGESRYFSGAGIHPLSLDSLQSMLIGFDPNNGFSIYDYTTGTNIFRNNITNGTQVFSQDGLNYLMAHNDRIHFQLGTGDSLTATELNNVSLNTGDYVIVQRESVNSGRFSRLSITDLLAGAASNNFANANLTWTGTRTHNAANNTTTINNIGGWVLNVNNESSYEINGNSNFAIGTYPSSSGTFTGMQARTGVSSNRTILDLYSEGLDESEYGNFEVKGTLFNMKINMERDNGILLEAIRSTTRQSDLQIRADSIMLRPYQGQINIDSLRVAYGDSLTWKPVVWSTDNKGLKVFNSWGEIGFGSGGENVNVGSGYRWLKPTPQEIKTAFAGNGILIDSTSNTDGLTFKSDTSTANANSNATNARVNKVTDSLLAILEITTNPRDIYDYTFDISGSSNANMYVSNIGTGSHVRMSTVYDNWFGGVEFTTGAGTTGTEYSHFGNSGVISPIAIDAAYRYNFGAKLRFEDLSDGTDTYHVLSGFSDHNNDFASMVDGVCFTYTHGTSSGQWVCHTRSNSSTTSTASGVTVAADTDYYLQISIFNNEVKFYINNDLVHTETSTIPTGATRATSIANTIRKSAGTNPRKMYIENIKYGKVNF